MLLLQLKCNDVQYGVGVMRRPDKQIDRPASSYVTEASGYDSIVPPLQGYAV